MQGSPVGITSDFIFEGGSEAVVDLLCEMYPESDVYTSIYDPDEIHKYPALDRARKRSKLHTSLAQIIFRIPGLTRLLSVYHFYWLYFLSSAIQTTRRHRTVIVSSCAHSKLIRIPRGTRVIVYFHTPTRWLYPGLVSAADLSAIPVYLRPIMAAINSVLRPLDRLGVRRLRSHDPVWLCNSSYTRDKLREVYGIEARVIFPPVDVRSFGHSERNPKDFFVYHGRVTFQKRVDVAIQGCLLARKRLVISGRSVSLEVQAYLEGIVADAVAQDPSLEGTVTFLGRTSDQQLRQLFAECQAMVFPAREDFGIAPIEAIASGVPVIAYRAGGALDYVKHGINGCFFEEQTSESLAAVLRSFDVSAFSPQTVAESIPDFSRERYEREMRSIVDNPQAGLPIGH